MSKRLQVVLEDEEFEKLRRAAARDGFTVSGWVRQSLRLAHRQSSAGDVEHRLGAIRTAVRHSFPTADVEQLLDEIQQGYLST